MSGAADVAGDLDGASGRAEDRAEQLGRRRLPVRAGDADQVRAGGQQPIAELDLAPDGDAARAGAGDERRLGRYARALDHQFHPLEQRLLLSPSFPSRSSTPRPSSLPTSTSGERSAATTWTPRAASAAAAARPDRASPTTSTRPGSHAPSGDGSSGRVPLTAHAPPHGGRGPLGSAYAPERNGIVSTFSRMGYGFAVRFPHPQPAAHNASSSTGSTSTCSPPAGRLPTLAPRQPGRRTARPPADSPASSSAAATSSPSSVAILPHEPPPQRRPAAAAPAPRLRGTPPRSPPRHAPPRAAPRARRPATASTT